MAMLAEKKRKTKYVLQPVSKPLWKDDSQGKKMMEKMGWSVGKGLGASEQGINEPISAIYKQDNKGYGNAEPIQMPETSMVVDASLGSRNVNLAGFGSPTDTQNPSKMGIIMSNNVYAPEVELISPPTSPSDNNAASLNAENIMKQIDNINSQIASINQSLTDLTQKRIDLEGHVSKSLVSNDNDALVEKSICSYERIDSSPNFIYESFTKNLLESLPEHNKDDLDVDAIDNLLRNINIVDNKIIETKENISILEHKKVEVFARLTQYEQQESIEDQKEKEPSPVQKLLYDNRRKAKISHAVFDILCEQKSTPLYNQPCDALIYHQNIHHHSVLKPKLLVYLRKKCGQRQEKELKTIKHYDKLYRAWKGRLSEFEAEKQTSDRYYRELFLKTFPQLKKKEGNVSSNRSKIKNKKQRANEELKALRKMRASSVVPPMLFDASIARYRFVNKNGLIMDLAKEYAKLNILNTWQSHERKIFKEKYLQNPKNFRLIASSLTLKTTQQCINYYYLTKKVENYKQVVGKHRSASNASKAALSSKWQRQQLQAKQPKLCESPKRANSKLLEGLNNKTEKEPTEHLVNKSHYFSQNHETCSSIPCSKQTVEDGDQTNSIISKTSVDISIDQQGRKTELETHSIKDYQPSFKFKDLMGNLIEKQLQKSQAGVGKGSKELPTITSILNIVEAVDESSHKERSFESSDSTPLDLSSSATLFHSERMFSYSDMVNLKNPPNIYQLETSFSNVVRNEGQSHCDHRDVFPFNVVMEQLPNVRPSVIMHGSSVEAVVDHSGGQEQGFFENFNSHL